MGIGADKASQLVESQFVFDKVGGAMSALRKAIKGGDASARQSAQERLSKELVERAAGLAEDKSPETMALLAKAVEEQVKRYADGLKAASSGCGGYFDQNRK